MSQRAMWGIIGALILILLILLFGVPLRKEPYTVQVPYTDTETYIEKEPYEALETYTEKEPYEETETYWVSVPYTVPYIYICGRDWVPFPPPGRWVDRWCTGYRTEYQQEPRTRTVTKWRDVEKTRTVTKYRDVQKQRTVTKYRTETRYKRLNLVGCEMSRD